ncbi:MAG: hypothetical protein KF864_02585 [Phycisphaeraceae bacterium]|nr:hypothetical protein [Phycisphaeraceae bacterium]MBX3410158.1 hypothetical protein [Phycisphaeraceae bacterium]
MDTHDPQTPATIPQVSEEDRYKSPYPRWEQVARLAWALVEHTLFRFSFPTWYGYRAALLRLFGAKVGANSRIRRTVHFECPWNFSCGDNCALGDHSIIYALGRITLHNRVCLSQYAHLCAGSHDLNSKALPLLRPPITLKDDAWLLADSFVGPSVTLHEGALLGARSSAFRDLEPWSINVGSPARKIKDRPRIDLM